MKKFYNISTFLIFGFFSIITTFYFPYLNQNVGLSLKEVGQVVSVGALFTVIAQPIITKIFSKSKNKNTFIILYLSSVFITIIALMMIDKKTAIFYAPFYGLILGSVAGVFEIYIEEIATYHRYEFSDIRKWGSIGYAFIVFIGGFIINKLGYKYIHMLALILISLIILIIWRKFASPNITSSNEVEDNNFKLIDLIKNKNILFLIIVISLGIGSYMGLDFAYSSYLFSIVGDVDKANNIYSMSISFRVVIEFFSFMIVSKYANNLKSKNCLIISLIIASIKVLMFSTGNIVLVVLGDQLHGVMYGIYLTFLFKYLREIVEDKLVAITFSILSVLSTGGANFIYPAIYSSLQIKYGYFSIYLCGFGFMVLSILFLIFGLPNSKKVTNV
ncbi:MFS transporter [Clostridium sp.]|uniref:MFS transporter n=1 Tax=Clostridium sp. TaxID=1506 RepID=UPI0026076BA7|nr:MFS transporter [Clostridium sp.]